MRLEELFPIAGGLLLGCVTRFLYKRPGRWLLLIAAALVALCATVFSGEYRVSWGFLLVDLLQAGAAAFSGFMLTGLIQKQSSKTGPLR